MIFSHSQAVFGNAFYCCQAKLGIHFRTQVQLGNELKMLGSRVRLSNHGGFILRFPGSVLGTSFLQDSALLLLWYNPNVFL
jgi:hypothetical protein